MRRLIVCCDGTWNTPDHLDGGAQAPTNVVKMARAVLPETGNKTSQIVYYHAGVGTDDILDRITGGAFGIGLSRNIRDAYLFLVHNYAEGDEIYFFGFSRGAYTARSIAGMIRKVGILAKERAHLAKRAFEIYRMSVGGADSSLAGDFRQANSVWPVPIRFIGVWDTVGALGIPGLLNFIGKRRFQFHDVALSRGVAFAFQALAIDEKRLFFKPTLWEQHPEAVGQVMQQAWFPGVHMDVGSGYREAALADDAFLWMAEKAGLAGLVFDEPYLALARKEADPLGPLHESRTFPYSLIPAYHRALGVGVPADRAVHHGDSNEVADSSARARFDGDVSYRPPNLAAFLERSNSH